MDGLGRTIKTETGNGTTTVSVVDTVYVPCGCSPLGKMGQQSAPYAPGGTVYWTTYSYDGLGRTTQVQLPDGSISHYAYAGNVVTVTDPAGKYKNFSMDALGNLYQVQEPDPTLGTVSTNYTYDILNHLIQVSMPRGANTQTRTFNYLTGIHGRHGFAQRHQSRKRHRHLHLQLRPHGAHQDRREEPGFHLQLRRLPAPDADHGRASTVLRTFTYDTDSTRILRLVHARPAGVGTAYGVHPARVLAGHRRQQRHRSQLDEFHRAV